MLYKEESGSKFGFHFRATKGVGNDITQHLKMFGEVSKPLSVEMNEIWPMNQTSEIALEPVFFNYSRKNTNFPSSSNYHLSCFIRSRQQSV